ncbi:MAG TPA: DUF1835 domain-containing protein, partial [Clostridia bacterium]|nr:DUF1835 domain-containing protein [Clostridia bacterium]
MIEVMFGESEGGAMKMAKNYKKPDHHNGAWFGNKPNKEEFEKMFDGQAVGGNSSEVVCLPLMLDIGDINQPIDSDYRKNLILEMYTINGRDDLDTIKGLEESWDKYLMELERLMNYASKGEHLRIWYSNAPYSLCGLSYVCNL